MTNIVTNFVDAEDSAFLLPPTHKNETNTSRITVMADDTMMATEWPR